MIGPILREIEQNAHAEGMGHIENLSYRRCGFTGLEINEEFDGAACGQRDLLLSNFGRSTNLS
jgi:hypothetical protein